MNRLTTLDHCPRITLATQHITNARAGITTGIEVFTRLVTHNGAILSPLMPELTGKWPAIDLCVAKMLLKMNEQEVFDLFKGDIYVNIAGETLRNDAAIASLLPIYHNINQRHSGSLVLEISECAADGDIERHWSALAEASGAIALDDYGKEASTPERLARFDWNICKINNPQVLKNTLLTGPLQSHHRIIVENIETRAEMQASCDAGFDVQQGYWHHKPTVMPPSLFYGKSNALGGLNETDVTIEAEAIR